MEQQNLKPELDAPSTSNAALLNEKEINSTKIWVYSNLDEIGYFEAFEIVENSAKSFYMKNPFVQCEDMSFESLENLLSFIERFLIICLNIQSPDVKLNLQVTYEESEITKMKAFDLKNNPMIKGLDPNNLKDITGDILSYLGLERNPPPVPKNVVLDVRRLDPGTTPKSQSGNQSAGHYIMTRSRSKALREARLKTLREASARRFNHEE